MVTVSGIDDVNNITLKIYNNSGVLLFNKMENLINGKLNLNLFHLSSGIYIFEISSEGRKETHKAIKI